MSDSEKPNDTGGFRYGVRHVAPATPTLLIDFVSEQMLKESNPSLSPLELIEMGSVYVRQRTLFEDRSPVEGRR